MTESNYSNREKILELVQHVWRNHITFSLREELRVMKAARVGMGET